MRLLLFFSFLKRTAVIRIQRQQRQLGLNLVQAVPQKMFQMRVTVRNFMVVIIPFQNQRFQYLRKQTYLVVAGNHVAFPPHKLFKLPGRFLLRRPDGTFAAVEDQAKAVNKNYAITPLTSDFNLDGYPYLVFANISGKSQAHIHSGGDANYIAFRFPETAQYAGAKVTVTKNDGSILSDVYVIGEGLVSDQTATLTFGLGDNTSIKAIELNLPNGTSKEISDFKLNKANLVK